MRAPRMTEAQQALQIQRDRMHREALEWIGERTRITAKIDAIVAQRDALDHEIDRLAVQRRAKAKATEKHSKEST